MPPTPVFLLRESYAQRSLEGYSPWGCKESDTTEWLSAHTHTHSHTHIYIVHFDGHFKLIQHCKSTVLKLFKRKGKTK